MGDWKDAGTATTKTRAIGDGAAQVGRGEDFERKFEALANPVKTKNKLGFIADIASFHLVHKSSNLVMFWLPKIQPKVTKISFENGFIWVEFVNF